MNTIISFTEVEKSSSPRRQSTKYYNIQDRTSNDTIAKNGRYVALAMQCKRLNLSNIDHTPLLKNGMTSIPKICCHFTHPEKVACHTNF